MTNSSINFDSKFNKLWRKMILSNLKIASNRYYYGYYVSSNNIKSKQIAKYLARYVRHPAIANGRIVDYNKKGITFYYKDYESKGGYITKPVTDFISLLIQHIPPKQFKMIRHYGAYSRNQKRKYAKYCLPRNNLN